MFLERFKDGLAGHLHNQIMQFYPGCDTEENYLKNCEIKSTSWYYYNNPIEYKFNNLGFRCNDVSELTDDYLLFTGCSLTEGVGLHLEDTYPYLVSKALNKTYFNLALGGTGPNIVKDNLIMFLSNIKKYKLPKCIIIQWPDFNRFTLLGSNFNWYHINAWSGDLFKEIISNELPTHSNILYRYITLQFIKNMGIDVVELGSFGDEHIMSETIKCNYPFIESSDKARDLSHPGVETHKLFAKEILNSLNKM